MFSNFFLKSFRILLLPFSLLYWLGIAIRNWLFDKNIFKSTRFGLPLISVGNLSVGGTGKSPMVEYLVEMLKDKFRVATLSRGYKRKTKGYALANETTTALEIGDEPMQFHLKYPGIPVAVGEERIVAIPQLLHDRPETQAIILDDAFQHRTVEAGLNILLTDYNNLFTRDFYLPTGDLRDLKSSYKRAHIIIITKCKPNLSIEGRRKLISELKLLPHQHLYFTAIEYGDLYHITTGEKITLNPETEVLLVTGIANPRPLKKMLEEHSNSYHMLQYSDHHIFTIDDLNDIKKRFEKLETTNKQSTLSKIILTTEKDAVRLVKFNKEIAELPLYVIPVRHQFLFDEADMFNKQVTDFIQQFKKTE
ncbi:MAG: tetraacyldisaccharide 4'-kinase [Chitinophagaceae bacterium]|nr:tetraacyldisaccharide 4'-kinase [Chitinophagaceae bacterium]